MRRRTSNRLVEGVYEDLITEELASQLAASDLERVEAPLPEVDVSSVLARHAALAIEQILAGLPNEGRAERARELTIATLEHLAGLVDDDATAATREQRPTSPLRRLLAVHRGAVPIRPATPLSTSTLLTRNRAEPNLGQELAREIATADRIDAIIAFVTVGGVRVINEALQQFARRQGATFRLLTTTFTGTTEVAALDSIARMPGSTVRIGSPIPTLRFHLSRGIECKGPSHWQ